MSERQTIERDALPQIVGELLTRFPTLSRDVVTEHVRQAYASMNAAPVQDYVPVLVQREARLSLTAVAETIATNGVKADAEDGEV
ncbi:MAG: hypothetical protein QOH97_5783 [Actinoplanes sp.]|jgi:hypothetical protein|nr:hypothetical protein [Actinoplanes sp.]